MQGTTTLNLSYIKIGPAFAQSTFLCFNERQTFRHVFVGALPL